MCVIWGTSAASERGNSRAGLGSRAWQHRINPSIIIFLIHIPQGVSSSTGIAAGLEHATHLLIFWAGTLTGTVQPWPYSEQPPAPQSYQWELSLHPSFTEILNCWEQAVIFLAFPLFPSVPSFLLLLNPVSFTHNLKTPVDMNELPKSILVTVI